MRIKIIAHILSIIALIAACLGCNPFTGKNSSSEPAAPSSSVTKEQLIKKYRSEVPTEWGENVTGVKTSLNTSKKVIALTLDACGADSVNGEGSGYDAKLIAFLRREQVPATLFINSRWIKRNEKIFRELAEDVLFEIENHGTRHLPLSVIKGKEIYGIKATESIAEVIDEIQKNSQEIEKITGRAPKFFRSGTAYYDDIAVKIANDLGLEIAGFNLLGDNGALYNANEVYRAYTTRVRPGAIIISHMNHPEKDSSKGIIRAIPELRQKGYTFVKLENINELNLQPA